MDPEFDPCWLVGDVAFKEPEESPLAMEGMLGYDERLPPLTRDPTLARDPSVMKFEPGKSPNFGNANWKSLLLLLNVFRG